MLVMPDVALETELLTLVSDDARLVTPNGARNRIADVGQPRDGRSDRRC